MQKWIFFVITCFSGLVLDAQDVQQLRETARSFQRQGDYDNAILVLNKAASLAPADPDIQKELGIAYYVNRKYDKALELVKPLSERADADEQSFQILSLVYRGQDNLKEAEKVYKTALKKFPQSGLLYASYGELLDLKEPGMGKGIQQWEKGIEVAPESPNNYYHATKYYLNNSNSIWGLVYGEVFVNLESFTGRTTEIKNLLLDAYKKTYASGIEPGKGKTTFENELLEGLKKQTSLTGNGINAETLTAIRTRFILDWNYNTGKKYPFKLFELHQQLLQEGLFESYNQWLFGSVDNILSYQNWTNNHKVEYSDFNKYQRNRMFKVPTGQYYNK